MQNTDNKAKETVMLNNILNTPYQMPEYDPIRGEICECLIYGLDVAAITATNFLVEHF